MSRRVAPAAFAGGAGPLGTVELPRNEYGVEAHDNIGVTPWMRLAPDLQFVRPARKSRVIGAGTPTARPGDAGPATVIGLRLQPIF